MRAFDHRRPIAPNGWGSAPEMIEAIAAVLERPKTSSTVRETWRLGRDALLKKAYLSRRVFDGKKGPEIRYALRYVDGNVSLPYEQYRDLSDADRELLFPHRELTKSERTQYSRELGAVLSTGLSRVRGVILTTFSTGDLEAELLKRLDPPAPELPGPFALTTPADLKVREELLRRPSLEFAAKLYEAVKGSGAQPSTHSTEPQTPTLRRASSVRRRRGTRARSASPERRRSLAS